MKKLVIIGMTLVTLMLALALCGCGNKQQSAETTETAQPVAEKKVDLVALRDQMIADYGVKDPLMIETAALQSLYGIAPEQVVSSAGFSVLTGSAFPDEILMIEAKDSAAADDIQAKLENHLNNIAEQAASYEPESEDLAGKCGIIRSGNYVAMFFTTNYDAIAADFQESVG